MQRSRRMIPHNKIHCIDCSGFAIRLILCLCCALFLAAIAPRSLAQGETPAPGLTATPAPTGTGAAANQPADIDPMLPLLIILIVSALVGVPVAYFLFRRPTAHASAILLVSTDDSTSKLVISAAKQAGYQTVHVYRYEDALDRLRQNPLLRMVIIDDSVPQYEVGLLVSTLQRMPAGSRPLILIQDNSELGQTAFSHRAEALVSRPLTEQALELAIRQVGERTTPLFG